MNYAEHLRKKAAHQDMISRLSAAATAAVYLDTLPVLVACECSQVETLTWRAAGIPAFSCDVQPCHGPCPQWHIHGDALEALRSNDWGLVVAHPPCTYLTAAGGRYVNEPGREELRRQARDFFMYFYEYRGCPVAIENPRPLHTAQLPPYNQVIDPTDFGSNWHKRTCLWLIDLPPLLPTHARAIDARSWVHNTSGGQLRSMAFPELAIAFTTQWLPYVRTSY